MRHHITVYTIAERDRKGRRHLVPVLVKGTRRNISRIKASSIESFKRALHGIVGSKPVVKVLRVDALRP